MALHHDGHMLKSTGRKPASRRHRSGLSRTDNLRELSLSALIYWRISPLTLTENSCLGHTTSPSSSGVRLCSHPANGSICGVKAQTLKLQIAFLSIIRICQFRKIAEIHSGGGVIEGKCHITSVRFHCKFLASNCRCSPPI